MSSSLSQLSLNIFWVPQEFSWIRNPLCNDVKGRSKIATAQTNDLGHILLFILISYSNHDKNATRVTPQWHWWELLMFDVFCWFCWFKILICFSLKQVSSFTEIWANLFAWLVINKFHIAKSESRWPQTVQRKHIYVDVFSICSLGWLNLLISTIF